MPSKAEENPARHKYKNCRLVSSFKIALGSIYKTVLFTKGFNKIENKAIAMERNRSGKRVTKCLLFLNSLTTFGIPSLTVGNSNLKPVFRNRELLILISAQADSIAAFPATSLNIQFCSGKVYK